jgi:hypothetical protein
MPKKTREEKMAAQLRRMKEQLTRQQSAPASVQETLKPTQPAKQEVPTTQGFSVSGVNLKSTPALQPTREVAERYNRKITSRDCFSGERYNYAYIARDLKKIATLAAAAIALEIILNLTTRASFAKLILRTLGIDI